jgi:AcrR family transcriptional regulator
VVETSRGDAVASWASNQADDAPAPVWRTNARSSRVARTPLTQAVIVEAALKVLDRDGLEALSMRRVSDELGTGPASIYWHVHNKDELLQLVYERATADVLLPTPDPTRWAQQLEELAAQMRSNMKRHRDIARISMGRMPSAPTVARYTEWLFTLMRPVGIPDAIIAKLGDLFALYIGAFTFEESIEVSSPTGADLTPDEILGMWGSYFESLSKETFPHLHQVFHLLFANDTETRFAFGVNVLIRGIATYVEAPAE